LGGEEVVVEEVVVVEVLDVDVDDVVVVVVDEGTLEDVVVVDDVAVIRPEPASTRPGARSGAGPNDPA
jgi:hypothetical protein